MTQSELNEMKRVFSNGWEETDIPSYIRTRDEKEEIENTQKIETQMWAEEKLTN